MLSGTGHKGTNSSGAVITMSPPPPTTCSIRPPSRRGRKTYSGCWTGRQRRVKCDENHPVCKRCSAASVNCQGYEIRLTWQGYGQESNTGVTTARNARPTYSQRSSLPAVHSSINSTLTRAEVALIQHDLDCAQSRTSSSKGPFSVFCTQPLPVESDATWSLNKSSTGFIGETEQDDIDEVASWSHLPAGSGSSITNPGTYHQSSMSSDASPMHSYEETDTEVEKACQNERQSPRSPDIYENDAFQTANRPMLPAGSPIPSLDPSYFANSTNDIVYEEDVTTPAIGASNGEGTSDSNIQQIYFRHRQRHLGTRLLDHLPAPIHQKELIHHWATFLNCAMAPVPRFDKPGRDALTSIALTGVTSTFQESNGEIAVFHGICAASAFSLSQLRQYDDRFHNLAIKHRQLALGHLRHSMQSNNLVNSGPTWAAIMTFFIQEGVRGQPHEWRVHLRGLDSLILSNPQLIHKCGIARSVYEWYLCIKILGNIQNDSDVGGLPSEICELKTVGPIHGLSSSVLDIIQQINTLSSSKTSYSSSAVDKLELLLWLQSPASIDTDGLDHHPAKLLVHCSHIYHCAALIHLQRALRKTAPDSLQDLVETAIDHLEAIEMVGNRPKGCIWAWPCIVISAECTTPKLQARMLEWFECKRRHGFLNLQVACNLATEVWRHRAEHKETAGDVYWQNLICGTDYDVLPL